ncbi:MAG: carbon-nitrogen hydrolase family protein [Candidatus Bathycorpusculaceae bacterium]
MKEKVTVALAQTRCKSQDKRANLNRIEELAAEAKEQTAELVIFPELSLTGYVIRDQIYELAEPIPGPSTKRLEKIARKTRMHIIAGMPELSEKARATLFNTAIFVSPQGLVGKYRKMYLPTHSVFEEKRYFRSGYQTGAFDTALGKVGLTICYDIYFPEVFRLTRLKGAELIVCISASPSVRRSFFEILTAARAVENAAFLAYVNLVGVEDGLHFWGGSRLIGPTGEVLAKAKYDEEDFVIGEVDYSDIRPMETFVPTLKDLRPELFDELRIQAETL